MQGKRDMAFKSHVDGGREQKMGILSLWERFEKKNPTDEVRWWINDRKMSLVCQIVRR